MSNLLLECLFQIRALRDTVGRVRDLASAALTEADTGELLRRVRGLLAAEAQWQEMLRAMLPAKLSDDLTPPEEAPGDCGVDLVEAFARARMATHAALDACNAADLGRLWPIEVVPPAPPGTAVSPFGQSPSGAMSSGQPPAGAPGEGVTAPEEVAADLVADARAARGRTVADVVAMMLANDTEALGGLRHLFGVRKR